MKIFLLAIVTLSLLPACRADLIPRESYTGFALPPEPVLPEVEVHPSLWFGPDEVPGLVAKQRADDHAMQVWEEVLQSEFLLAPLPEIPSASDDKKTIHQYYGSLTQIAFFNAFFFQITPGEAGEPFLARAREALLRGYAGPLYELDPIIKGSAVDEIYQGTWAQNFAAAYDWVQPALSPEDDAAIRKTLADHAQYTHERLFSWIDDEDNGPHNHLSKPAWGLGSVALCLADDERAGDWLARAIKASNANTRYYFGEEGIYREGSHYYTFSLINFVPFLYHYRNASGVDGFGFFQPAFEWPVAVRNGQGWIPNFEDSYIRPFPSQLVAGAYLEAPTFLSSSAPLAGILQWNFETTDYLPFDIAEEADGFNYTGATWDYPKALVEFITYRPGIKPVAPDAGPTLFMPSGQTVFRNDWSYGSPEHRYLLFQGVAEADNHEHYEHLSFILQAENQMMSSDAGYSRGSYAGAERTDWYVTPEAHNVVMVNGMAPCDRVKDRTPESFYRLRSPFFASEMKIAPYAAGGEHRRLVAMVDGKRFSIVDQVELPEAAEIAVVMHGGRAGLEQVGPLTVWNYQPDAYGPAAVLGQWFFGEDFAYEEKEGELTYIKGDYGTYPYWVNRKRASSALALSMLDPASQADLIQDVSVDLVADDRISVNGPETQIMVNGSGDLRTWGDLQSDGILTVAWTESGSQGRLAMVGGQILRQAQTFSIELSAPAAIAVEPIPDAMVIYLSEDWGIEARITVGEESWEGPLVPGRQVIVFDR